MPFCIINHLFLHVFCNLWINESNTINEKPEKSPIARRIIIFSIATVNGIKKIFTNIINFIVL